MKERPILFSGEMVRALLAGRKTQTRRVVKPQPSGPLDVKDFNIDLKSGHWLFRFVPELEYRKFPYGAPGDRLWVRETWREVPVGKPCPPKGVIPKQLPESCTVLYRASGDEVTTAVGWRPSIHMPRWASRLTLEIVAVRVERLLSISEADALAEGVFRASESLGFYMYDSKGTPGPHCCDTARDTYAALWESINGPGSWALNPWVWVIEFKKLEAGV